MVRPSRAGGAAARLAGLAALARCAGCRRPQPVCVCDRLAPLPAGWGPPVVVLRHPGEIDHVLGSAELVAAVLPGVRICDGLSWGGWAQLAAAAGLPSGEPAGGWGVLWPLGWPAGAPAPPPGTMQAWPPGAAPQAPWGGEGATSPPAQLAGLVVLDGTWRQAKTLWWRNAWLLSLVRVRIAPASSGAFGRLRRAPSSAHISTLETVAAALEGLGAPPAGPRALRRVLRTLAQRVRDWPGPGNSG